MAVVAGLPRLAGRSPLFRWMFENREEFAAVIGSPPDWSNLAVGFARTKLLDRNGKPPTAETARITWWKVRRYAAELNARGVAGSEALRVKPIPQKLVRRPARAPRALPEPATLPVGVQLIEPPPAPSANIAADLDRGRSWITRRGG